MKRILIIKGSSQYDVLRHFCDEMLQAFCKSGCLVTMFDYTQFETVSIDRSFLESYDFIFSFNGIGIELYNQMIYKPLFWTFLVDHPFYHDARLKQICTNRVMVSCIDRRHVAYIDKYYKNIPYTCFMPHGGLTGTILPQKPYSERLYNVVFLGSITDLSTINPVIKTLQDEFMEVTASVIETSLKDFNTDLEDIVYERMNHLNMHYDNSIFTDIMYLFSNIDALRRYYKRLSLIDTLTQNMIHIDIWGNGWNNIDGVVNNKHITLHGNVNYEEAKLIMRNSKIVLSDMPMFHDGSHERVFASMQSGAISSTDNSGFLEECFEDGKEIVFYEINNIEQLAVRINSLLNNPDAATSIIESANSLTEYHTWQARAKDILEVSSNLPF